MMNSNPPSIASPEPLCPPSVSLCVATAPSTAMVSHPPTHTHTTPHHTTHTATVLLRCGGNADGSDATDPPALEGGEGLSRQPAAGAPAAALALAPTRRRLCVS